MANAEYSAEPLDGASYLLLRDEVGSIVRSAAASGETLRLGPHVKRLREQFALAGLPHGTIADELILSAAQVGVPVELTRSADD
jgi:hypothetical protein